MAASVPQHTNSKRPALKIKCFLDKIKTKKNEYKPVDTSLLGIYSLIT